MTTFESSSTPPSTTTCRSKILPRTTPRSAAMSKISRRAIRSMLTSLVASQRNRENPTIEYPARLATNPLIFYSISARRSISPPIAGMWFCGTPTMASEGSPNRAAST